MPRGATRSAAPLIVAEPPPRYRIGPPMVVDCSAVCAVLFDEPERDAAAERIARHTLYAPSLLDYEFASVVVKKLRGGMPAEQLELAVSDYAAADVELRPVDREALIGLAERYTLSAYDAAYLLLAAELKAPLVTFDRKLGAAARQHLRTLGDDRP